MADFPTPPDFASQLDPNAFQVQGTDQFNSRLGAAAQGAQSVNFDWTNVNSLLGQLAGQQGFADARAKGQGLTAGDATREQQQNLGDVGNDPASLGKALMHLGSKMSSNQAGQVAQAQGQQQQQAMQQAAQLRQAQAQARLDIYKQELALQDQKFQLGRTVKQAQDGLSIFNLQLKNMFNEATNKARNVQELGQIAVQRDRFNQSLSYVGMALGAGSALTAGGMALASQGSPTGADNTNQAQMNSQGYVGPAAESTAYASSSSNPFYSNYQGPPSASNSNATFWMGDSPIDMTGAAQK